MLLVLKVQLEQLVLRELQVLQAPVPQELPEHKDQLVQLEHKDQPEQPELELQEQPELLAQLEQMVKAEPPEQPELPVLEQRVLKELREQQALLTSRLSSRSGKIQEQWPIHFHA